MFSKSFKSPHENVCKTDTETAIASEKGIWWPGPSVRVHCFNLEMLSQGGGLCLWVDYSQGG